MKHYLTAGLLSAALLAPLSVMPLRADDHDRERVYHDEQHHDDHHWDKREDQAYRMWVREQHRRYQDFNRLNDDDQRAYWNWRHEHSDAVLRINIR